MLSIFESSIALEIKDSVDRQQLQNVTTAEGNYQFYCLHKLRGQEGGSGLYEISLVSNFIGFTVVSNK